MPLADAVTTAQNFVTVLYYVYLLCIIAYILTSWGPVALQRLAEPGAALLYDVVDPYLRVFRRMLPQLSVAGLGARPLADRRDPHADDPCTARPRRHRRRGLGEEAPAPRRRAEPVCP